MEKNICVCLNQIKNKNLLVSIDVFKEENHYAFLFEMDNEGLFFIRAYKNGEDAFPYLECERNHIIKKENYITFDVTFLFQFDEPDLITLSIKETFLLREKEAIHEVIHTLSDRYLLEFIKDAIIHNQLGADTFIYQHIGDLFRLIRIIQKKEKIAYCSVTEKTMDEKHMIQIAQDFLFECQIDVDIQQLLDNETIKWNKTLKKESGISSYDAKLQQKIIWLNKTHDTSNLVTIVHEILHYTNQPDDNKRSEVSNYLTEAVSYSYELILLDKLLDTNYKEEALALMKNMYYTLKQFTNSAYYILLSILLVMEKKDFQLETTKKYFNIKNYTKEINQYLKEGVRITKPLSYIIGIYLAISNFVEYKKDPSSLNKIHTLNYSLNDGKWSDCFNILEIKSRHDLFSKCSHNIDQYIHYLSHFDYHNTNCVEDTIPHLK